MTEQHGGKRKGSGRRKGQPTKLMRVPVRFEKQIKEYIQRLKAGESQPTGESINLGESIKDILKPGVRNTLVEIRKQFSSIDRATLDAELAKMALNSEIYLYPLDDPTEITQQDREAAIDLGGVPQYLVYI
jgi:hypothetical protein